MLNWTSAAQENLVCSWTYVVSGGPCPLFFFVYSECGRMARSSPEFHVGFIHRVALYIFFIVLIYGFIVFPYAKCSKLYYVTMKSGIILFCNHPFASYNKGKTWSQYTLFCPITFVKLSIVQTEILRIYSHFSPYFHLLGHPV